MVAPSVSTDSTDSWMGRPALVQLLYALTGTTTVMLLSLACALMVRRVGGQLKPLNLITLFIVAVILAGQASLCRFTWYRTGTRFASPRLRAMLLWSAPSAVVLVSALALSIPDTHVVSLVLFWGLLISVEGLWWTFAWRQIQPTPATPHAAGSAHQSPETHRPGPSASETGSVESQGVESQGAESQGAASHSSAGLSLQAMELELEPDGEFVDEEEQLPDDVSQQITRSWEADEKDTVTGLLRARFEPKVRSQSVHVALCPPMLRRPDVSVIQMSGPRARIKAADTQPFGIRFDLRLAAASDEAQDILLHFEAHCGNELHER